MQRYFIKEDQVRDGHVEIVGSDVHHMVNVMRFGMGDRVILCTDQQQSYVAEILSLTKTHVRVKVVNRKEEFVELPVFVTIAQGMIKLDKMEWVIQKGTECGASGFMPVRMKRSVAKVEAKKADSRRDRWQKIALEAARQSHRQVVPTVGDVADFDQVLKMGEQYDLCLFAYEAFNQGDKGRLATVLQGVEQGAKVLILIGPEGGIDETEVEALIQAGFCPIGLGPRILRTETAPIYVLSAMSYVLEIERGTLNE